MLVASTSSFKPRLQPGSWGQSRSVDSLDPHGPYPRGRWHGASSPRTTTWWSTPSMSNFGPRGIRANLSYQGPNFNGNIGTTSPFNPYVGAWTPTPQCPSGALARFFPEGNGLTSNVTGSAHRKCSLQCNFNRVVLLGVAVIPLCSGSHAR